MRGGLLVSLVPLVSLGLLVAISRVLPTVPRMRLSCIFIDIVSAQVFLGQGAKAEIRGRRSEIDTRFHAFSLAIYKTL